MKHSCPSVNNNGLVVHYDEGHSVVVSKHFKISYCEGTLIKRMVIFVDLQLQCLETYHWQMYSLVIKIIHTVHVCHTRNVGWSIFCATMQCLTSFIKRPYAVLGQLILKKSSMKTVCLLGSNLVWSSFRMLAFLAPHTINSSLISLSEKTLSRS